MTIASGTTSQQLACNGTATQFSFGNKIFAATDLVLTLIDTQGNQWLFTNFANATLGLSYTVQNVDVDTGCFVVFNSPPANGWTLDIRTAIPQLQSTSVKNQGPFLPELHEEAFDRLTRVVQDLMRRAYLYGIHGPDTESTQWPQLPGPLGRRGYALMFDAITGLPGLGFLSAQNVTQGLLTPLLNPQTAAEAAAGIVPNTAYGFTDPRRFGAKIDGATDDTLAIQNWINLAGAQAAHAQQVVLQGVGGICMVSQITFAVAGIRFIGNGMAFRGNATSNTTAVVEIKGGPTTNACVFLDLVVDCNFNANYQCAVHWYTNNLNLYNPSFCRIVNLQVSAALIGLCIGALPSQSLPIPAQGTVQAPGIATDAPLSESALVNFTTGNSCVRGLWVSQPNCKLSLTNCTVIGGHASWTSYGGSGYTNASTCALVIINASTQSSEISMQGGELVQNSETTGNYVTVAYGHLYCVGTTIEVAAPSYFSGEVGVVFRDCLDFGFNFPSAYVPFLIDQNAVGFVNISGSTVQFPNGDINTAAGPLFKGASSSVGSFAPNYGHVTVNFDRVDLQDVPYLASSSYGPVCLGVNCTFSRCTQTSWTVATRNVLNYLDDRSESLLDGIVDATNSTISAYPQTTNTSSGGWTFAVGSASDQWGSEASGLTVEGFQLSTALHMLSIAAQNCQATSPLINVTPERTYQLKGWIKCPTTNGGAGGILFRALNFVFSGGASATPTSTFVSCPDTAFGNTWQQLSCFVTVPKDTTKIQLNLLVQNAAGVQLAGLQLI